MSFSALVLLSSGADHSVHQMGLLLIFVDASGWGRLEDTAT